MRPQRRRSLSYLSLLIYTFLLKVAFGLICLSLTACNDNIIDLEGEQHVRVYQDDLAISCADTGGISVKAYAHRSRFKRQ